jgi:hypothetical protein
VVEEGAVRTESGKEFQTVGEAKEKDLRPSSVLMKGTVRRCKWDDLRVLEGLLRWIRSRM